MSSGVTKERSGWPPQEVIVDQTAKTTVEITFRDGATFSVRMETVAKHYASTYSAERFSKGLDKNLEESCNYLFNVMMNNRPSMGEWMCEMNWSDLNPVMVIPPKDINYGDVWRNHDGWILSE